MIEHDGCVGCKYELESEDSKYCMGCKQNSIDKYTKKTNFDMIKNMSKNEFAEWLATITDDAQLSIWNEWLEEECWE